MKKITELSLGAQLGIFLGLAVAIVAGGEYFYLGALNKENADKATKLADLEKSNNAVEPFKAKLADLKRENAQLDQQLANLRSALPEEKEADAFIRMVKQSGADTGVEVRRFTAKALVNRDFYSEMPFEVDIDGAYFSVLQFFDRMGRLERIVNISNLTMGPTTGSVKGVKKKYTYAPNETVIASCTATTYFGREPGAKP